MINKKLSRHFKPGFSLLELLVVISIIGILISVGVMAFGAAQKKTRDARRISDLKAIQTAEEQYFAANGIYYKACGSGNTCSATSIPGVMDQFPVDPKNSGAFTYKGRATDVTYAYCIYALLETSTGNCGACPVCISDNNCPMDSGTTHYCVTNLQ